MATMCKETVPDFGDVNGQNSEKPGRVEQTVLEAQSEESELMQCNIPSIEGKAASAINMAPPLTLAHIYGKKGHMHETTNETSGVGGDKNSCNVINMGNHATPTTKLPTWTGMSKLQSSEAIDKQGRQRQIMGQKREFHESNMTLDSESLRNEKKTKPGIPNIPMVEAAVQPRRP
nr:hypothetical protein CFP56_61453 [Quercus suber]